MKVCVVGAGAIGGYMAVRIAAAGHEVSVVARGPHLAAIKAPKTAPFLNYYRVILSWLTHPSLTYAPSPSAT